MEHMTLQKKLINKVKAMSEEQLSFLESVLSDAPFTDNETERKLVKGIMLLQDMGGSFDFLHEDSENYSIADCQFMYDPKSDQLIPNDLFKTNDP